MTERFLLAAAIILLIGAGGLIVRGVVRGRAIHIAAKVVLPATLGSPRLLLFSTRFCAACETQRDVVGAELHAWPRPIEVSFHDAAMESELARGFGILTVPALVVAAADGHILAIKQGFVDRDGVRSLIAQVA
jgi:hypothetical protein